MCVCDQITVLYQWCILGWAGGGVVPGKSLLCRSRSLHPDVNANERSDVSEEGELASRQWCCVKSHASWGRGDDSSGSVQQQCFYPLCYKWQSNLLIVMLPWVRFRDSSWVDCTAFFKFFEDCGISLFCVDYFSGCSGLFHQNM